jgi:hypothetical protein
MMWCAQDLTTLRGVHLEDFVIGAKKAPQVEIEEKHGDNKVTTPNLAYEDWKVANQQVLSYILASMTKETLVHIATTIMTVDAWKILKEQFASQTRARVVNVCMTLATT